MATKYRITVDGKGRYWAQRRVMMFAWADICYVSKATQEEAQKDIDWCEELKLNAQRMPVEGRRTGLPSPTRPAPAMPKIKPPAPPPPPPTRNSKW